MSLHQEIESVIGERAAIGIHRDMLAHLLDSFLQAYNQDSVLVRAWPIPGRRLAMSMRLARTPQVEARNVGRRMLVALKGTILSVRLCGNDPNGLADEGYVLDGFDVSFPEVLGEVGSDTNGRLVLSHARDIQVQDPAVVDDPTQREPTHIDDKFPKHDYEHFKFGLQSSVVSGAPDVLLKAVPIDALFAIVRLRPAVPYEYSVVGHGDYLMISSPRPHLVEDETRDCFHAGKDITVTPGPPQRGTDQDGHATMEVPAIVVHRHPVTGLVGAISAPSMFLYVHNDLRLALSRERIGGAVSTHHDEPATPFYWQYNVTAALDGDVRIETNASAQSVRVSTKWAIFGAAGAGIEIECVRYEVLGATVDGRIGDLSATLALSVDQDARLVMEPQIAASDAAIRLSSTDLFPLDVVATRIFRSIQDKIVKKATAKFAEDLRMTLIDPAGLPLTRHGYEFQGSISDRSELYGIKERKG